MSNETLIGLGASILSGISMLPQLLKIYKEKKKADISYPMICILIAGLSLWIWYGIKKEDPILIYSNSFAIFINVCVIVLNNFYSEDSSE